MLIISGVVIDERNGAEGLVRLNRTVYGSTTVTELSASSLAAMTNGRVAAAPAARAAGAAVGPAAGAEVAPAAAVGAVVGPAVGVRGAQAARSPAPAIRPMPVSQRRRVHRNPVPAIDA